jgi:fibronectin-binding autotransporter adhesin
VSSGGQDYILSGGAASGTKVIGGTYVVFGTASGTTISSGGVEYVYAGGTETNATIVSGLQVPGQADD